MKRLNAKKVLAVGAGLALVAASVSAAPISFSDLVDEDNKVANVNGIVVGANADPMDTSAAQKLATFVAEKAVEETTTTEEVTTMECPVEEDEDDLSAGLELDRDEGYRLHANLTASGTDDFTSSNATVGQGKVDGFIDETKTQKIDATDYSVTVKEQIVLRTDAYFDKDKDRQWLGAKLTSGNLDYNVALSGTDLNFTPASGSEWTDGANDHVSLPFFGDWYTVNKAYISSARLDLVKTSAPTTYNEGDEITGVLGKDGESYKIVLDSGFLDGSTNTFTLTCYNEDTGELVATEDFTGGSDVIFYHESTGEELLEDNYYLEQITKKTVDNSEIFTARVRSSTGRVVLRDGYCFPDYTESDQDECDWRATVSFNSGVLTNYGIENTSSNKYSGDDALRPGQVLKMPNDYIALEFVGLQLPEFDSSRAKEVNQIKFGVDVQEDGYNSGETSTRGIEFLDNSDVLHRFPFYVDLGEYTLDTTGENDGMTFTIDSVEKIFAVQYDGSNVDVYFTDDESGSYSSTQDYWADENTIANITASGVSNTNSIYGKDDFSMDYNLVTVKSGSDYHFFLALRQQTVAASELKNLSGFTFHGTDFNLSSNTEADFNSLTGTDTNLYLPQNDDWVGGLGTYPTSTQTGESKDFFIATFDVSLQDSAKARIYIDTEDGKIADEDNTDNSLSWATAIGYDTNGKFLAADINASLKMESGELQRFYNLYGDYVELVDDEYAMVQSPDARPELEFYVYASEGIAASGEPAEDCDEEDKTEVTKTETVTAMTPYAELAVLADDVEAGNYVIIGGWAVNELFANGPFADQLQAEGSEAVMEAVDGSVYIAGWSKEDTMKAVDDVIALLEEELTE